MLENEEDEETVVRCTEEQELSEMTNGTNKPPVKPTESNRSSSSSDNGEFRDSSKFMAWALKYDWLYRKCISLQELRRDLVTFKLKKYPAGSSKVGFEFQI